jgi:hypothetical protein
MENQQSVDDLEKFLRGKRKREFRQRLVFGGLVVLIFLFAATQGSLLFRTPQGAVTGADALFPDCSLKQASCTDSQCSFYNACDGIQPECRIYDCGADYGIYLRTAQGEVKTKREKKPDTAAIAQEQQDCRGTLEVLEQGCKKDGFRAKVKVATQGACPIGGFVLTFQESGNALNRFERAGDGVYLVASDQCGTLTRIAPVTAEGMVAQVEGSYLSR